MDEQIMRKINNNTHLIQQAKVANVRLEKLRKPLDTDGSVHVDAMLEVLYTENSFDHDPEMRKPKALKRPMQPGPSMCQTCESNSSMSVSIYISLVKEWHHGGTMSTSKRCQSSGRTTKASRLMMFCSKTLSLPVSG